MKRSFWFHYNKPASRAANKPQITVHYQGQCLVVDNIVCNVPTAGRLRKTQPFWVIAGKTKDIQIENGIATIQ